MSALDQFFAGLDLRRLAESHGWTVSRDGDLVRLTLAGRDGEAYTALIECSGYPQAPPSVVFVNAEDSKVDRRAWPRGTNVFHEVVKPPASCFLCMPLTREGLRHHPEWASHETAWTPERTLLDIFNYLNRLLNGADYLGRGT